MTDETKKQRKPSYTVSKWAEENGYTDAMLALLGDDAKEIMPAVKAVKKAKTLMERHQSLLQEAESLRAQAEALVKDQAFIDAIKARLEAIKKAATGE